MDDEGQAGVARHRLARISRLARSEARGDEPARTIAEAIERLMRDREAAEAIAEWSRER
jgi:hypothetical protein